MHLFNYFFLYYFLFQANVIWVKLSVINCAFVWQLGAGVGLPGVVAGRCGARVMLSDSAELPLCLRNCRRSCDANSLPDVPVIGLTWGQVSPELLSLTPLDIILGSDVFYEPEGDDVFPQGLILCLNVTQISKYSTKHCFGQILKTCS